ncbi:ATP-binding protein [Microlunatus endophyticus]|nr:tetratricopeptide repeat protein [Microlunatus endophyticus]
MIDSFPVSSSGAATLATGVDPAKESGQKSVNVTDALRGEAPDPGDVVSMDDLAARLQELRLWAGVSYRELHRRVLRSRQERTVPERPSFDSVHRCLQPGRRRVDQELVVDIAGVLLGDREAAGRWRQACRVASGSQTPAGLIAVTDLPTDLPRFVGRSRELEGLRSAIRESWGRRPTVLGIRGMGGVGKTSLATRLGRGVAMRVHARAFAVDLRGYDPALPPVDPVAVLDGLLRAFGLAGSQIAGLDLGGRTRSFRRLVRDQPLVLLLDNAADADQLLPLLPESATGLVLITSRNRFDLPGATTLDLAPMDAGDAVELLGERGGSERVSADPKAAQQLVELAGHLPLAIDLLGSRIASDGGWTLADHIERLREATESSRLDDAVDAALGLSYQALDSDRRRLLRLLALHPGREFDAYAAAALADTEPATAIAGLDGLVAHSLLLSPRPERYRLHDLVRTYVAGRVREEDPASRRRDAQRRLFGMYAHAAVRAARMHAPEARAWLRSGESTGAATPEPADAVSATAWFETEASNLLAAAWLAVEQGWSELAAEIAMATYWYLYVSGRTPIADQLLHRVVEQTSDLTRADVLTAIAIMAIGDSRYADAERLAREALGLYQQLGDAGQQSAALNNLGIIAYWTGRTSEATRWYEQSLELAEKAGDPGRQLRPIDGLGRIQEDLGNLQQASVHYRRANELAAELGDPVRQVQMGIHLADLLQELGSNAEAIANSMSLLELARSVGYVEGEIYVLATIGAARTALADYLGATAVQAQALDLARNRGLKMAELQVLVDSGTTLLAAGRPDEAQQRLEAARELADELGQRAFAEDAARLLVQAARALEQPTSDPASRS